MKLRLDHHDRKDRGAAAVEFALLVPILLLLVFGIVDFARGYSAQVTVTHAAREGVRVQALGGSPGETTTATQTAATPLTVTVATGACTQGQPTSVTATTAFTYVTPVSAFMQMFGGAGVLPTSLSGTGVMRCGG
jgi:Flp pilus assembly protein TadG